MAGAREAVPAGDGGRRRRGRVAGNRTLITLVGLGPGRLDALSIETLRALDSSSSLLLRTARHPTADDLHARGTGFTALDSLYEAGPSLPEVYAGLAAAVLER